MDRAALRHHAPTCVSSSSSAFLDIRSILFAGVNTDQCVMCTLQDANFLGYGCILVEDCCATSSPDFCTQATVWNVKKCRSEEHTSELQSLMRISYAVFCLKKKTAPTSYRTAAPQL